MHGITIVALSAALLAGCEAHRLDQQMKQLCDRDGGVKIYETVKVPPAWLDFAGRPNVQKFPRQVLGGGTARQAVADRYIVEEQHEIIKRRSGDDRGLYLEGRLDRYRTIVRRMSDNKILGEEVSYGRSGGDISLGHPSSNSCPNPRPSPDVVQSIFIKEE